QEETMGAMGRGPGLYEFLVEAELQPYYGTLKNDLRVNTVAQIKYVEDEDLAQVGMSKPEMRRLKKYFHKYYPQTYLRRIKQMILPKREEILRASLVISDPVQERGMVKVPSKHIISSENITINKELGVGEFGVVQQGVWTNEDGDRIQVAIKKLSKERMQNNSMEFLKEAAIMHTVDHEHVVRLYGVVLETSALMLVTELAPLRSLLECLKEPALRPSFPILSLCDFAFQICDGMQYLESKRLIHRDLAARNILVFSKNKIKISDFGLSRALGVGKDYYQTNFNVNLKLPIAWCAPECINYLRFTSASDVWAYGVTLWEMFSYGFQPWAALTGQQILEAIDEPNFQRLEQPECCPKEYYILMLKCWQHDPNKRPKFSDISAILPECKPEQVQCIKDYTEDASSSPKSKREQLQYKVSDVIAVLDKKPLADSVNVWKGALTNCKTGLFNPAHTVAYLGTNIPSMKPSFTRSDSKSGVYSSKRRLRAEMISRPQADFRHTGHVGLDGAFFGDISCLGDKYHLLPKQIVTPYKPHEDGDQSTSSLNRAPSDVSDRAPLLIKGGELGKGGPAIDTWSDSSSDKKITIDENHVAKQIADHEYHEISDDENQVESPRFETFFQRCLDFGPSLMDEVFKALGNKDDELEETTKDESNNVRNEIREMAAKNKESGTKKKQATVKPISASDQRTLESAIAMANEMASKSMLELVNKPDSDLAQESPHTPSSPTKRKFSFRLPTAKSPKNERRNFTEETESIADIQESLTEEAKDAYNTLVEKGQTEAVEDGDTNPLRMLRSGLTVRPKVRGNKHGTSGRNSFGQDGQTAPNALRFTSESRIHLHPRNTLGIPPAPPVQNNATESARSPPAVSLKPVITANEMSDVTTHREGEEAIPPHENGGSISTGDEGDSEHSSDQNPLPLPPRDRTKPMQQHKPRQRKHPLIIPGSTARPLVKPSLTSDDVEPVQTNGNSDEVSEPGSDTVDSPNTTTPIIIHSSPKFDVVKNGSVSTTPPAPVKPPRVKFMLNSNHYLKQHRSQSSLDDSFDNQIQADMDSLDDIPEEEAPLPPVDHHVSCEDLLDFACDRPNTKRTQGRARGTDADEVRILQKVLAGKIPTLQVTREDCVATLNETDWDVHKAIKYMKLQTLLRNELSCDSNCKQTLVNCDWDVQKAYSYLLATYGVTEDSTEV
uniref:non-specific protein-tyrosine kinase n=1 Tax=Strigamia maritima TaxID=126957 RepID=T1ISC4_STRMM